MIAGMPYFSKELDIAFDLPVSSNAFSSSVIAAITPPIEFLSVK